MFISKGEADYFIFYFCTKGSSASSVLMIRDVNNPSNLRLVNNDDMADLIDGNCVLSAEMRVLDGGLSG